jgi:DNA repair ATPase RecN
MDKLVKWNDELRGLISEVEFYKDDIKFIEMLINRFLEDMLKHENLDELRESMMRLHALKTKCNTLLKGLKHHRQNLNKISNMENEKNISKFENSLNNLTEDVTGFRQKFQNVKQEIYRFADDYLEIKKEIENAIEEEKIRSSRNF